MTPQGLRLWTTDGAVHETTNLADWPRLPAEPIAIIQVVYDETYQSWTPTRDAEGRLGADGEWVTEHYTTLLHQLDWYWQDADGLHATNVPAEIPAAVRRRARQQPGLIKRGGWMTDQAFVDLYNRVAVLRGPVEMAP